MPRRACQWRGAALPKRDPQQDRILPGQALYFVLERLVHRLQPPAYLLTGHAQQNTACQTASGEAAISIRRPTPLMDDPSRAVRAVGDPRVL